MAKRNFLLPLALILSSLGSNSQASTPPAIAPTTDGRTAMPAEDKVFAADFLKTGAGLRSGEPQELLLPDDGKLFSFVIQRAADGQLFVGHRSHSSHRSHASHRSHYSSR